MLRNRRRMFRPCAAASEHDSSVALVCSSITADSVQSALHTIEKANVSGADVLELRLDFYQDFESQQHLEQLMDACKLPFIVTCRPTWEGCGCQYVTACMPSLLISAVRTRSHA
jgi:3-dehydroquinate dehydratase type I